MCLDRSILNTPKFGCVLANVCVCFSECEDICMSVCNNTLSNYHYLHNLVIFRIL